MTATADRRRVARFPVPSQFTCPGLEHEAVRLVDLSPEGACLEHVRPLPDWDTCFVVLPPALGGLRLQGEVVWSRVGGRQPGTEGKGRVYYQSGLHFTGLTPEQRVGLTAALQFLKTAQQTLSAGPPGDAPGESGGSAKSGE